MKKTLLFILALICGVAISIKAERDLTKYALPIVGSQTNFELSNGNIYPCIALPRAMNHWAPQTLSDEKFSSWFYSYNSNYITGLRQTHQPSPWIGDYAAFALMPTVGEPRFAEEDRKSWYSHKSETANPNYYKVYLAEYDVMAELTPSERGCIMQFTYPNTDEANLVIDVFSNLSEVKVIPGQNKIVGYSVQLDHPEANRVPENFKNYFVIDFSKPIRSYKVFDKGLIVTFSTGNKEVVTARVASSFISSEQAQLNLEREINSKSFSQLREEGRSIWNKHLSRFLIEDNSADDLPRIQMFYTALYRTLLFPRTFHEYNEFNEIVHYSPFNGKVEKGRMYTDNGYWDTFRAVHPFLNLFYPEFSTHIAEGLVNTYKESGWLPEWVSPGHFNCMIGSNSASLIASSYLNGIEGMDMDILWEAAYKNAYNANPNYESVGRAGIKDYMKLGYVPNDVGVKESAARTLEYCYADYCMLALAKALKKDKKIIKEFEKRSKNYKNIFHPDFNLMAGKDSKGQFRSDFNPFAWGGDFTEGNSWHYTWSVFHDPAGLMALMGGREKFVAMMDSVFSMPPVYDETAYGIVIHEIREMQIMNFGQYAHGNQPIQHGIYLYNWAGEPWKSQYWARQAMDRLYHPAPDGYCGDEDNGQTSAWYVFSALGFYPACPVTGELALGSPIFKKVTIDMENGEKLVIEAPNNNNDNVYVNKIVLNNQEHTKNYFDAKTLAKGSRIQFDMSPVPNKQRGTEKSAAPFSLSE